MNIKIIEIVCPDGSVWTYEEFTDLAPGTAGCNDLGDGTIITWVVIAG